MNLVLTFCSREWRAQRGVLLGYTLLALASLCLVFLLVPQAWWLEGGQRALALSWFVAIGVIGVGAFVAPALVRSEYASKDDQFVRRLPGALWPSFGGKLLFLTLTAAALPLLCLLVGEGFLLAISQPWHDLFTWENNGEVYFRWPWMAPGLGYAALLVTWVWAIGMWLPAGRMALGGVILFVLLLGVGVFAVLRQSPGIESGIAWQGWLWPVPVLGLLAAMVSWTMGRRGGGPLRSARLGLAMTAVGLLPPSAWLANRVFEYHHPDLARLSVLYVHGASPDGQFVLAHGAAHDNFSTVPIRIDLRDGSALQLGGIHTWLTTQLQQPSMQRYGGRQRLWRLDSYDRWGNRVTTHEVLDLLTGQRTEVALPAGSQDLVLPAAIAAAVESDQRASTTLRAPGGKAVWFCGNDVCVQGDGDVVHRVPWQRKRPSLYYTAAGHGLCVSGPESQWFDFVSLRLMADMPNSTSALFVHGAVVYRTQVHGLAKWWRRLPDGEPLPMPALDGCSVLGLFDDEHLLCRTGRGAPVPRLFLWHVHDDTVTDLSLPPAALVEAHLDVGSPVGCGGSLLPRDQAGRIWLRWRQKTHETFWWLDTKTRAVTTGLSFDNRGRARHDLLAWPDANSVLVTHGPEILRVELASGARTVLFPRPAGATQ